MRSDLTEAEIRDLLRKADRAANGDIWTPESASMVRRLVGEVERLRDREANVMQMHQLEGNY